MTLGSDSLVTPADGIARFAPSAGLHPVAASRFGYEGASGALALAAVVGDSLTLLLAPKPTAVLSGIVRDAETRAPLPDAEVRLAGAPIHVHADSLGRYALAGVPHDDYSIEVRRPGYRPAVLPRRIETGLAASQDFALLPAATWVALESESGWSVGDVADEASSGIWTRAVPFGAGGAATVAVAAGLRRSPASGLPLAPEHEQRGYYPRLVQPDHDRTPGAGTMCFVTGQGSDRDDVWENDVSGGRTTLTSPALDISGMSDPAIGYWRWFYGDGDRNDWLAVLVSADDGATWVAVDTTRGFHHHWEERTIRVAKHVAPSATARVRFVAADLGAGSIVEAAIDDLVTYDLAVPAVDVPPRVGAPRLALRAPWPNPARSGVNLALEVPRSGDLEVTIFDLSGRRVRTLHRGATGAGTLRLAWDGAGEDGHPASPGLFFVRASLAGQRVQTRIVRVR